MNKVCRIYAERPPRGARGTGPILDDDMLGLKKTTTLSYLNWVVVLGMTLLLLGVPLALGIITAFYTPQVGLSCRSFTLLIYAITQLGQLVLWLWAYNGPPHEERRLRKGYFHRKGFFTPTITKSLFSSDDFWSLPTLWAIIWYSLAAIFGAVAVLTSIGGVRYPSLTPRYLDALQVFANRIHIDNHAADGRL